MSVARGGCLIRRIRIGHPQYALCVRSRTPDLDGCIAELQFVVDVKKHARSAAAVDDYTFGCQSGQQQTTVWRLTQAGMTRFHIVVWNLQVLVGSAADQQLGNLEQRARRGFRRDRTTPGYFAYHRDQHLITSTERR